MRLARPRVLVGLSVAFLVAALHLTVTPSNPPGYHRDEASLSYNAYTLSQSLRDQEGARAPLYFVSFRDWKSPVYVYALAVVFRFTGPGKTVARAFSAVLVLTAVLLLGALAFRLTGSAAVGVATGALAGFTPTIYELGRVALEGVVMPLVICLLLLLLESSCRGGRWTVGRGVGVGATLGLLTYTYSAARLLAPLFAVALVVFLRRGRVTWLASAWATFAVALVPLAVHWRNHPGAQTSRYEATTFVTEGMPRGKIVTQALKNYLGDVDLWAWVTSGDWYSPVHTWGTGSLLAVGVVLALAGAAVVGVRHRNDAWWRYVLVIIVLSPIPSALTKDRLNALRLMPFPLLLTVLAIPALALLAQSARRGWLGRGAAFAAGAAAAVQFAHFAGVYVTDGPKREQLFEAGVPTLLDRAFAKPPVHVDYDELQVQAHLLWYAAVNNLPRESVAILPDGGVTIAGGTVVGRFQGCDYVCEEVDRWGEYWIAVSKGPKPN